jgi:high-affinity Fe2+/Pb2+ permease
MRVSRIKFVSLFLVFGFAYMISTRLILNQMPASLYGSDFASEPQAAWQSSVSLLLSPVKFVLMGPLRPLFSWMLSQQDADPPPPMLALMYAVYWTILALVLHYFLTKKKPKQTVGRQAGESNPT